MFLLTYRQDNGGFDIIGYETVTAWPDADLPSLARVTVLQCLQEAIYDQVGEKVVYENRSGVALLQERDRINIWFETLEKEM